MPPKAPQNMAPPASSVRPSLLPAARAPAGAGLARGEGEGEAGACASGGVEGVGLAERLTRLRAVGGRVLVGDMEAPLVAEGEGEREGEAPTVREEVGVGVPEVEGVGGALLV